MIFKYIVTFFIIEILLMAAFQCDMALTNNLLIFFLGFWLVNNMEKQEGGSDD